MTAEGRVSRPLNKQPCREYVKGRYGERGRYSFLPELARMLRFMCGKNAVINYVATFQYFPRTPLGSVGTSPKISSHSLFAVITL